MPLIRAYPVDLGQKDVRTGMYDAFVFDDDGIPAWPYETGPDYNITFICHYALYQLSLWQRFGREDGLERFEHVSRWVLSHGHETDDSFSFPYEHPLPGLDSPWLSALGQGRIMSVLTRAAQSTGDDRFQEAARKAVEPLTRAVDDGGVRTAFPDGSIAFEEYPRTQPNIVLNGLITSLFGLFDVSETGDATASALLGQAIEALASNLHRYDLGYWSAYDLTGPIRRVAGDEYHAYHIAQLWALYEMTGKTEFADRAHAWDACRGGTRLAISRFVSRVNTRLRYA
ncbi:MAG: hypothetical protein HKN17_11280 [Rhodothermales bacterium]|nr:hypothetical protein [Rhodothermales bacterium]